MAAMTSITSATSSLHPTRIDMRWAWTLAALVAFLGFSALAVRIALTWFRLKPWPWWIPEAHPVLWAAAFFAGTLGLAAWLGWRFTGYREPPSDGEHGDVEGENPYKSPQD